MSYTIHRAALAELRDAAHWYRSRSRVAAIGFVDAVEHAIDAILSNPEAWPQRRPGIRAFVMARYPFLIIYRLTTGAEPVRILAIAHARRRPDYWQRRK